MSKFIKACLIAAISFIAIGLIFIIVAVAFGGTSQIRNMVENGDFNINHSFFNTEIADFDYTFDGWNNNVETYSGVQKAIRVAGETDVNSLSIDLGGGAITLVEADQDYFSFDSNTDGEIQCYAQNGSLNFNGIKDDVISNNNTITLYVPRGFIFEQVDISIGAGDMRGKKLVSDEVNLEIGAGNFQFRELKASELTVDVGAGNMEIKEAEISDADLEVNAGKITLDGSISGDLDADVSMGAIEMMLLGNREDHNYEIDSAAGSVRVDESYDAGVSFDHSIDNHVDSTFTLECAVGDIKIDFRK